MKKYLIILIFLILASICFYVKELRIIDAVTKLLISSKTLILFQNNAELRATGGFIGSYAVLDTTKIKPKLSFNTNIYKQDGELINKISIIPSDQVLRDFLPEQKLQLRDSNWLLDFQDSSKIISEIYYLQNGYRPDNIIAIDTEPIKKILDITGPIVLKKYDLNITSENFNNILQKYIEVGYYNDESNLVVQEPKEILTDLYPIIISRLSNVKNAYLALKILLESIESKNVLFYTKKQSIAKTLDKYNATGRVSSTKGNYLYINESNLGCNKSSIYVKEDILVTTNSSKTEISIKRFYTKDLYDASNKITDKTNKNFYRILLPRESQIKDFKIDGIDQKFELIYKEDMDKNELRFWNNLAEGEKSQITFVYSMPKQTDLYIQKQPGAINQNLFITNNDEVKYNGAFTKDISIAQ